MQKTLRRLKKLGVFLGLLLSLSLFSSCAQSDGAQGTAEEKITFREAYASLGPSPTVSAKAAIGIETSSGEIFYSKNIDERLPMASTTKIMTAIVALEKGRLTDTVKINKNAVGVEGSSIYLFEGEALTLENLLYALLLESANDAATAIAIHIGGSVEGFVELMNQKAEKLGLCDTHFDNPHGLDSDTHFTTARELGIIAAHAMKNPKFREIVSTYKTTIPLNGNEGTRVLINHNKLLRNYDGSIGIKTGYTKKSGRCLVSASSRDGVELICVTISASNDWQDHESILDFGNSLYESTLLASEGDIPISLPVIGGRAEKISLCVKEDVTSTVRKNDEIKKVIEAQRFVFAPISKNQIIGKILFIQNGNVIAEAPLIARDTVARSDARSGFFKNFSK